MRAAQLASRGARSAFRNRLRTGLTAVAVAVGAFALTLTAGLQTGVDQYIDTQLATIGSPDLLFVTKDATAGEPVDEPVPYDPERSTDRERGQDLLDDADLSRLADVEGIEWVQRNTSLRTTWMSPPSGERFAARAEGNSDLVAADLDAGAQLDRDADERQLLIPVAYLDRFGFDTAEEALDARISVAVDDFAGNEHVIDGTVVGVQNKTLQGGSSTSLALNTAMTEDLYAAQNRERPEGVADAYLQAVAKVDLDRVSMAEVKDALADISLRGQTFADQLGEFRAIVSVVTAVLTAFAGIALLAAGFGIVNTLLMSVKERTREIGLLKALGLGRGALFTMFSIESVMIGALGAVLGAGAAVLLWFAVRPAVEAELLADLPQFDLLVFAPVDIAIILLTVTVLAVAAGALPALRASRMQPVEALRYE